ncbi:class IV lanthionine synthetase LanL [Micromonospora sp. NPDC000089]|uniref:class IV lanthionine synthetase LanL n=1 Tax=unclassified Micromonospora TaxID=2617518 RepID=UPI0036A934D9
MSGRADDLVLESIGRAALPEASWRIDRTAMWCHARPVGSVRRLQGWKLHVSATPLSAPVVLARAIDVLREDPAAFKFASTLRRVEELVESRQDRGAGGKFITIYPDSDAQCQRLAQALDATTFGLAGPGIMSDRRLRPGSLVHCRFGAFTGVPALTNDGEAAAMLVAPDGTLERDHRGASFTPPSWAPAVMPDFRSAKASGAVASTSVLLNDRYVVRKAIRHRFKGGVYRASDTRTGREVVIKQARPHVAANLYGLDVRDALRNEERALNALRALRIAPAPVELFEQQGDLFLVEEALPGTLLLDHIHELHAVCDGIPSWDELAGIALGLVDVMEAVHSLGYVLRDFTVNNIMIDGSRVRLVDLEFLARPDELVRRVFTPGHAAPEQRSSPGYTPAPGFAADRYSLGAVLFCLVSGAVPRLAWQGAGRSARQQLLRWAAASAADHPAAGLGELAVDLMIEEPASRPDLATVRKRIEQLGTSAGAVTVQPPVVQVERLARDAVQQLLRTRADSDADRLWPAGETVARFDPVAVHAGAAGVLAALVRAATTTGDDGVTPVVRAAVDWIQARVTRQARVLPGLYFGRAGTAWALLDAASLLKDQTLREDAVAMLNTLPVRWPNPDQCHGASGAGTALLHGWRTTADPTLLDRAVTCADGLLDAAHFVDDDVYWTVPADFDSVLKGTAHYGYAHGVAGIATFLLAVGQATGNDRYLAVADRAGRTLQRAARLHNGAAYFPVDRGAATENWLTHWCSGSSGIGTFLVRLWSHTRSDDLYELVEAAARAVHRGRWRSGTAFCHGLAGDGEFLLDVADATGDGRFRSWAEDLALCLSVRAVEDDGLLVVPGEDGEHLNADFATGLAGIGTFLLRLQHGGPRLWLPRPVGSPTDPDSHNIGRR